MEELNDDELQELLGKGPVSDNNSFSPKENGDLLAYQQLFKTLASEPAQGLPFSFAANVKRKAHAIYQRKSDKRFNILALAVFTFSLALAYGLLTLINPTTGTLVWTIVLKFKWVLLMITSVFFCFLLIDQRLLKRGY